MKPPKYYSERVPLLDRLKQPGQEDEQLMTVLERGTLEWTPGVADKLLHHVYDVMETKLKYTTQRFQRDLDYANGEEAAVVSAIVNARHRFELIYRLCRLAVFPDEVKQALLDTVKRYVEDTQNALLDSARHDRTGRLAYTIRNNSLVPKPSHAPEPPRRRVPDSAPDKPKRRVLF
jgi:hypothetical protein